MAKVSSTGDTPEEPAPETEEVVPPATEVQLSDDNIPVGQRQMNEVMAANPPDPPQGALTYPPGSDELNADNVRRYPELFTEEQIATIPTDELPETDLEKAQREAAEQAEADKAESES